jgi:hypothetical protein
MPRGRNKVIHTLGPRQRLFSLRGMPSLLRRDQIAKLITKIF